MTEGEKLLRMCRNCEYFDGFSGDCLNKLSPHFQTTADDWCQHFYPDTTNSKAPTDG